MNYLQRLYRDAFDAGPQTSKYGSLKALGQIIVWLAVLVTILVMIF